MLKKMKHKADKVVFYQSAWNSDFRWRIKSRNGRIVAASSEGFKTKAGAERNLERTYSGLLRYFAGKPK